MSTRGHAERDNTIEIRIQNRDRIQKSKTWKHGVSGVSLLEFAFFKASTHLQSTVPERWWLFTYFGEGDWLVDLWSKIQRLWSACGLGGYFKIEIYIVIYLYTWRLWSRVMWTPKRKVFDAAVSTNYRGRYCLSRMYR